MVLEILKILNFVVTVLIIFVVVEIGLCYLKEFICGVGDQYQSWRNFKYWLERDTRLIDLEYAVKEIKEKVAKNG